MAGANPFIAEISMVPFNFAPKGWASCDGQLFPISQYTALFSLLGTTYGGDGKATFALPDLQGKVPMHPGQGPGLSMHDLGETGGSETVTLLESEIPSHSHNAAFKFQIGDDRDSAKLTDNPVNNYPVKQTDEASDFLYSSSVSGTMGSFKPSISLGVAGGNQPHNNMQPYLTVHFIIAIQGVYPPRS